MSLLGRLSLCCFLLLLAFVFLNFQSSGKAVPIAKSLDEFPVRIGEWRLREAIPFDEKVLEILKPTEYLFREYVGPEGQRVTLYIGYWGDQRTGAQIHSPKNCLPGSGWGVLDLKKVTIPLDGSGESLQANRYLLQKYDTLLISYFWYQSRGKVRASEIEARLDMVMNSIFNNRTDGSIVQVTSYVRSKSDLERSSESMVEYMKSVYFLLDDFLPS